MKGIVIHSRGHVRRCLEGRNNDYQLRVEAIMPAQRTAKSAKHTLRLRRPLYFIFYCDGRPFASSEKVRMMKGRRYPDVEHWFILHPETERSSEHLLNLSALRIPSLRAERRA